MTCSFSWCLPLQNFSIQKRNQSSGNYSNSYALHYNAVQCAQSPGGESTETSGDEGKNEPF